jgi:hypothetical protein
MIEIELTGTKKSRRASRTGHMFKPAFAGIANPSQRWAVDQPARRDLWLASR